MVNIIELGVQHYGVGQILADVSEYLGYSKPSVSRAVGLLKNGGYLVVEDDGGLVLTDAGKEIGEKMDKVIAKLAEADDNNLRMMCVPPYMPMKNSLHTQNESIWRLMLG